MLLWELDIFLCHIVIWMIKRLGSFVLLFESNNRHNIINRIFLYEFLCLMCSLVQSDVGRQLSTWAVSPKIHWDFSPMANFLALSSPTKQVHPYACRSEDRTRITVNHIHGGIFRSIVLTLILVLLIISGFTVRRRSCYFPLFQNNFQSIGALQILRFFIKRELLLYHTEDRAVKLRCFSVTVSESRRRWVSFARCGIACCCCCCGFMPAVPLTKHMAITMASIR